jgi:hypothetical protein
VGRAPMVRPDIPMSGQLCVIGSTSNDVVVRKKTFATVVWRHNVRSDQTNNQRFPKTN